MNERPELRPHNRYDRHCSGTGRTTVRIDCPYCGETVIAYVWSLHGSGKRCPCGAVHTSIGTVEPRPRVRKP